MRGPVIPPGWERRRVGDIAEVVGGGTPPRNRPEYYGGSIPWVTPTDVTAVRGRYLRATRESITEEALRAASLRKLPANSLLVTSRATIGYLAITTEPVVTNQGFQSLIPRPGTDPLWLYYALGSKKAELERLASGSTFKEFSRQSLRNLMLLVPPPCEQAEIGDILAAIDDAIERTERVIGVTERLRQALLHDLLTRGIPGRHTEWKQVTGLGTMPACWDVVRLRDVAEVVAGFALGPDRSPKNNPKPYLTVANVQAGRIDATERRYMEVAPKDYAFRSLMAGDLVMVEGHANVSELGRAAIVPPTAEGFTFQNHLFRVRANPAQAINEFLCAFINGPRGRSYFRSFGGTTSGLNTVSAANVKALPLPLPPLSEQQQIVLALRALDKRLESEHEGYRRLAGLKSAVAESLLSGRVRLSMSIAAS
jgi:type I restriction enzyme S subunit